MKTSHLLDEDKNRIVRAIPRNVRETMVEFGPKVLLAGGFIRSIIAGEDVSDVDLSITDSEILEEVVAHLNPTGIEMTRTENAITIWTPTPIQVIHRWIPSCPLEAIQFFDFTVAMGVVWFQKSPMSGDGFWATLCHERFYADLAAKRLFYTSPNRIEDAGGSLLRVLKFVHRGYSISPESFASVLARVTTSISVNETFSGLTEESWAKEIRQKLREVDPLVVYDADQRITVPSSEPEF